jgi:hypothetical protein
MRTRRTAELSALALLLALTIGLRWYDDGNQARALERPESVTVVGRAATSRLGAVEWKMLGRAAGLRAPSSTASGAARLMLVLEARPLGAQGVKELAGFGTTFRVRDRAGHVWSADADPPSEVELGSTIRVPVTAEVPPDRLTSVVLEVLPAAVFAKGRAPVRVLRFAH